jgi:hypothetical protein
MKKWIVNRVTKGSSMPIAQHTIQEKDCKSYRTAENLAREQFIDTFPKGKEAGAEAAKELDFKYDKERTAKANLHKEEEE